MSSIIILKIIQINYDKFEYILMIYKILIQQYQLFAMNFKGIELNDI